MKINRKFITAEDDQGNKKQYFIAHGGRIKDGRDFGIGYRLADNLKKIKKINPKSLMKLIQEPELLQFFMRGDKLTTAEYLKENSDYQKILDELSGRQV